MPNRASSKAKGDRFEKRIKEYLEALGWVVERAHPKVKYIGKGMVRNVSHDIYGAFDFISFHRKLANFLMIQASTAEGMAAQKKRTIDELLGMPHRQWPHYVQVWLRDSNNRNRIIVWDRRDGSWVETSFRMEPGVWPNAVLGVPPLGFAAPMPQASAA